MENTTKSVSSPGGSSILPSGQDVARPSTPTDKPSFSKKDLEKATLTFLTILVSEVSPDKYKMASMITKKVLAKNGIKNFDEIEEFLVKNFFGPVRENTIAGHFDRTGFW